MERKKPVSARTVPPYAQIVAALPVTVPFVAPEAIERARGRPFALRLGANESSFGPSPHATAAMREAATGVRNYADPENYGLRAALASHHGVPIESVVVGSGIDDLLGLAVRAFLNPGAIAVTSLGAYPTFNFHVEGYGGQLERIPYRDDRNDLDALASAAQRTNARLVFLANPDNPSGSWYSAAEIAAFRAVLPEASVLLLDEAYGDFAPEGTLPPIEAADPCIIRLRTFSKAYGLAGARIGYAITAPETIAAFEKIRLHFGVNLVAQAGALAALEDQEYLQSVVEAVAAGRDDYAALARGLGLVPLPSATNFVTMDVGGPARARALLAALIERDVFIRMPGAPPLDRCIRVTVGTPEERTAFAAALREVWQAVEKEV
jgi:histidinol-phosphate aminotransferase